VRVQLHPEAARHDIPALEPAARLELVKALRALQESHTAPANVRVDVLGPARALLRLEGCLSIKFGPDYDYDSALRAVLVIQDDTLVLLAVGARQGSRCYQEAHRRLHPQPPTPRRRRHHSAIDWATSQPERRGR
jgi:hypothetical protein